MSITLELDTELETRLRAAAEASGQDVNRFTTVLLREVLERAFETGDELTDDEKKAVQTGIERGLNDGAAGRVKSATAFYQELNRKYGIL